MYSLGGHVTMVADKVRVGAYARALREVIRPTSVVVDLGAGTGIMGLLACSFGARRVFAVEPDDVIQVARELAAANGFADRIEFLQVLSTSVELPEKADVIVSDLRGVLPIEGGHFAAIMDARERFLAPGGVLIPRCDTLWAVPVESAETHAAYVAPGQPGGAHLNLDALYHYSGNALRKVRVAPSQFLAEPSCWCTLDYTRIESPSVSADVRWVVNRAGTAHGFVAWFDAELTEGVGFSNAPSSPEAIYGQLFFPWARPMALDPGDTVNLTIHANLVNKDYVWRWNTRVVAAGGADRVKSQFAQSSFHGIPLSAGQLRKQSAGFVPQTNPEAEVDMLVLTLFRDGIPLGQIARRLVEQFPARFRCEADALRHVAELSLKYSR